MKRRTLHNIVEFYKLSDNSIIGYLKDDFDLVITDMKMPGMDGIQVLKEIKTFLDPNVEVIIMTGYGTMESAI